MIEIVDDNVVINDFDNSDLLKLSDDDIVPPRPIRIHRSEYKRMDEAFAQYQLSKFGTDYPKSYDLSDVCAPSNLAQSEPEDVALFDFREMAASMRMTYGEFKEWMGFINKTMTEAFVTRGSLF